MTNKRENENEEQREAEPEELFQALSELPDEKVSAERIIKEFDIPRDGFRDALDELILLGEVELCQRRGTGPRIWLKRRESSDSRNVSRFVWKCYVAETREKRIADCLFRTKEDAIQHLTESVVIDPEKFGEVGYLDDVYRASTLGEGGYKDLTAVVRREPVYGQEVDNGDEDGVSPQSSLEEVY